MILITDANAIDIREIIENKNKLFKKSPRDWTLILDPRTPPPQEVGVMVQKKGFDQIFRIF